MTALHGGLEIHVICYLVLISIRQQVQANPPIFNSEYDKAVLFLPRDIKNGTAIYRFAASDNENQVPLKFTVESSAAQEIVGMVNVSHTEADLVLKRPLQQSGVIYEIYVIVTDTAGESTRRRFRINITDSRGTPDHVFIDYQNTYTVSEKEKAEAVIGRVTARSDEHMHQHVNLTIKGTNMFTINTVLRDGKRIVSGEIVLHGKLDYEKQSFYWIQIEALNGYIEKPVDTRNIIYLPVLIVVKDEQDTPPIFAADFPSAVTVPSDMEAGGKVAKVSAEDGDTDNKRQIRYSLVPGTDWQYFQVDSDTGEIMLTKSVADITQVNRGAPITLSIMAEEMQSLPTDEMTSTIKEMVVLLGSRQSSAPVFAQDNYEGDIEEHAPTSSLVNIKGVTRISDSDVGMDGVFALGLHDLDGTGHNIEDILEVTPGVMINEGNFQIKVKNPALLDYEQYKELKFKIVAKELTESGKTSSAMMTVYIKDINDNYPMFTQDVYEVTVPEDAKEGTFIVQVKATDADSDQFGTVQYTKIVGDIADKLHLDPTTGRVTVSKSVDRVFDRERQPEHVLTIEASDLGNPAKVNVTTLKIIVADVNDNAPQFKRGVYEVVVDPNIPRTEPFLQVEAVDADEVDNSNSVVRYEILRGNRGDMFQINPQTGELSLRNTPPDFRLASGGGGSEANDLNSGDTEDVDEPSTYTLTVRAYDLGIPHQNSTVVVYVHFKTDSRSSMNVTIQYIFPTSVSEINRDKERVERFLSKLNGASTTIERVAPYGLDDPYEDIRPRSTLNERSLVTTNVRYHKKSLVDLSILARNGTAVIPSVDEPNQEQNDLTEAGVSSSWKVALITLLIILAIILLLLICFCLWRNIRKVDNRKVHPADDKEVDKGRSQVIEVVTSDQTALANGRYNRQAGDKERLVANQQNGTVVPEMDSETQTTRRPTDVWNGSAGRGGIGVGAGQSRRPQVNYSRHLHGGVDGGPSTAGNSVRVELHDHERGTMRQGQLPLDDDLLLIEGGPSDHKTGQQQQRRYRLGTQYEDLEDQLEEIIVIDDRDGGAGTSTQRLPVRRIRRIVKRSPSRGQIDEYEEWGVEHPASLPEWYDGGDELVRRGIDGDNRRVIVRKYPGAGGGSLPGDLRQEGAWFNGGGGVHRQTPEVAGQRNRRNGEAFRASQRSRVRPRHRHFRDRSMTRGANSLRLDDGDSVEEAEVEAEDQLEEDDLIDFDEGRSQFRHQRVAFEEPAGRSSRSRRQNRGPTSYLRSSTKEDMLIVQRPRPKGNQVDQDDEDDQRTKPKRNKDRQDDEQRARPKGNKGHQDDEDDDEDEEADEDNDDEERADVTASKSKNSKKTHQSRAVSARPLSQDAVTVAEATMSKLDPVTIPETKDSSTSPKLPPPPPAGPNPELEESPQSSPSHVLQSEDKSEESPDNVPLKAANSNRRKAKRESRYMDWYKNIERGVDDEASHQRSRLIQQQSMMSRQRRGSDPSPHQRRKSRLRSPTTTSFDGNDKTTTKRSDTALDVLEAQMRLGGRDQDDDEEDSGIGHAANDTFRSSRKQFLEKKSLFTIAYNQNKQDALKDRDSSANNAPDNRIT